jgi:VWFA-related protein
MTGRLRSFLSASVLGGLFALQMMAQQNPPAATNSSTTAQADSLPVFHANTRVVLLDVIVSDKKGEFVPSLKAEDFTVLEDGKPQRISSFSVQRYETPKPVPKLQLPPNQFTNFSPQEPGGAVNIVMLDALNTPLIQQTYARKAILEFLKNLPSNQRVALFLLDDRPRLIQGFSGSSDALIAAAKSISLTKIAPLSDPGSNIDIGGPAASSIQTALNSPIAIAAEQRLRLTIASIKALAQAVSGYTGRKNLFWLSGYFPFRLDADFNGNNNQDLLDLHKAEVVETAALLAASQVAVYPIDVNGVEHLGGLNVVGAIDLNKPIGGRISDSWTDTASMEHLARETGGKAFYGSNAVGDALLHGLQQGSDYYTLAYTPENRDWNGRYRKLEVKVSAKGAKLTYRRGYYATEEKVFTGDQAARALATAVQATTPVSTMLLMKVQVLPPDKEHKTVRIDYAVNGYDISFGDTPGKLKHAAVDFMSVAWDKSYKSAGYQTDTVETDFQPEAYAKIMQTGFPEHQELLLKPGTYTLRLGVIDRNSQKIGTVDVPLTVTETETAMK